MGITHKRETVPRFSAYLLPEDEREAATFVDRQLDQLASLTDQVLSAVELFNFTSQIASQSELERRADWKNDELIVKAQVSFQWPFVVARSVAIAIHDFCLVKGALNTAWPRVPTLKALVDGNAVDRANKLFNDYFPRTEAMRDAACHSAERSRGDHYIVVAGGGRMSIGAFLSGNKLQYTYKKKNEAEATLYQLEISAGMISKLIEVRDLFYSGFRGVEPELLRRAREEQRKRQEERIKTQAVKG